MAMISLGVGIFALGLAIGIVSLHYWWVRRNLGIKLGKQREVEFQHSLKRKVLRGMFTWRERFYLWLKGIKF